MTYQNDESEAEHDARIEAAWFPAARSGPIQTPVFDSSAPTAAQVLAGLPSDPPRLDFDALYRASVYYP